MVRAAEQDAIARNQPEIIDQDVRNAVGASEELGIGPARAVGRDDRRARPPAAVDRAIEELRGAIHPIRVDELRQLENELGPELAPRQIVSCERIDVRCVTHVVVSATDRTAAFARPSNA